MAIKKQEFYEGAALHAVARAGRITSITFEAPFFILNKHVLVLLKYCTKGRSPWQFTYTPEEQALLLSREKSSIVMGLICGADGVAALNYGAFQSIAAPRPAALHIACYRDHGKHYHIVGPDGRLPSKVPPSSWPRILENA